MSKSILTIDTDKRLAILQFNRPEVRHALDKALYQSLTQHLQSITHRDDLHALILTGGDSFFTAGNDLNDFASELPKEDEWFDGLVFLSALRKIPFPVIAAVEGMAVGIGCTLLLHCDFIISADNTIFSMPFTPLGVCPEGGSSDLLAKAVGLRKAQEWLLLGRPIPAAEAQQAGLTTQTCPAGQTLHVAQEIAAQLAKLPRHSLLASKKLIQQHQHFDEKTCFDREQALFIEGLKHPVTQQIIHHFLKKTRP